MGLPQPQDAAADVEQRQRYRRDAAVAILALIRQPLRGGDLAALGVQRGQSPQVAWIGRARRGLVDGKGL